MDDSINLDELIRDVSVRMDVGIPEVSGPMDGRSHRVYRLKYTSGETWSLRIPTTKAAALNFDMGMAILEHLKKVQPLLRVPKLIYKSKSYTLLTFLEGNTLCAWDLSKLAVDRRHKLLSSFAEFLLKLWLAPAPQSGKKPTEVEDSVTGVVDWDTALYLPMPAVVHYPLFIANIPGWMTDAPAGMTFEEDRAFLESTVSKLAAEAHHSNASGITDLLKSSFERQFLELSLRNKRINRCYIDMKIKNALFEKAVIREQLVAFLSIHPELQEDPRISELSLRLEGSGPVSLID
ncbi:hypothetical protein E4U55_002962 [Claviceps digitariae]|nr:hypothetical protein E4U55_002962 [Claviceps digitariae]